MHMIPHYRWIMLATDFDGLTTWSTDMKADTNHEGLVIFCVKYKVIVCRMKILLPVPLIFTEKGTYFFLESIIRCRLEDTLTIFD